MRWLEPEKYSRQGNPENRSGWDFFGNILGISTGCSVGYGIFRKEESLDKKDEGKGTEGHFYTVGEICLMTGVTRKTLFYYDRIGLLTPSKRTEVQQFKLYDKNRLRRLETIITHRRAGLGISEIRELLDNEEADRLDILNRAMKRLVSQKDETAREIRNLRKLIRDEYQSKDAENGR